MLESVINFLSVNKDNIFTLIVLVLVTMALVHCFREKNIKENMNDYSLVKFEEAQEPIFDTLVDQESGNALPLKISPVQEDISTKFLEPSVSIGGISSSPLPVFKQDPGTLNPEELLPKTTDQSKLAFTEDQTLISDNFLTSGFSIGINTVQSGNKNPNLGLRADPPIPVNMDISPWNVSTFHPDKTRRGLELGN
jgi:hypothetical protein